MVFTRYQRDEISSCLCSLHFECGCVLTQIQKINMGEHVWLGDRVIHQQTVPARSVGIVVTGLWASPPVRRSWRRCIDDEVSQRLTTVQNSFFFFVIPAPVSFVRDHIVQHVLPESHFPAERARCRT